MVNLQEKTNFWENIINYQIVTYLFTGSKSEFIGHPHLLRLNLGPQIQF